MKKAKAEKIHNKRLLMLRDHLRSNRHTHEYFDITVYSKPRKRISGSMCESTGCALGECPAVFPKDWVMGRVARTAVPVLVSYMGDQLFLDSPFKSARLFFGLTEVQTNRLFSEDSPAYRKFSKESPVYITAGNVADEIDLFIGE